MTFNWITTGCILFDMALVAVSMLRGLHPEDKVSRLWRRY